MCSCTFLFHSQAKGDQQRYWEDLACPLPSTSGMCSHTFWIPTWCLSAYSCSSPTCHQGVKQKENPRGVLAWWATCVNRRALDSPGTRRPGARCTSASATVDMPLQTKKAPPLKVNKNSFSLVLAFTGKHQHCSSEYWLDGYISNHLQTPERSETC